MRTRLLPGLLPRLLPGLLPGLLLLLLAGCTLDSLQPSHQMLQPAGRDDVHKAAATLLEGIGLYESGDFDAAIATLDRPALQAAPAAIGIEALKYTAFSYCVTERYPQCRHAFDQLLAIDADFALRASEGSHPMWGPVFDQAKAASDHNRAHASLDTGRERWRGIDLWRAR
jgi:tetratricopeptide (TPR) repeat protein